MQMNLILLTLIAPACLARQLTVDQQSGAARFGPFDLPGSRSSKSPGSLAYRAPDPDGETVHLRNPTDHGAFIRQCPCVERVIDPEAAAEAGDGMCADGASSGRLVTKFWVYGQLIVHELLASVDEPTCVPDIVPIFPENQSRDSMEMCPIAVENANANCPTGINTQRPGITGDVFYSTDENYEQLTLRQPGTCFFRTSPGHLLPTAPTPDGYTMVAGDLRVSQHCALTAVQTLWMREHNRLCSQMNEEATFAGMDADQKWARAKAVVIAKLQQVTLQWLQDIGITADNVCAVEPTDATAQVSLEFGTVAMRFGHTMVNDNVGGEATKRTFHCEKIANAGPDGYSAANGDFVSHWVGNTQSTPSYEQNGRGTRVMCDSLFGDDVVENQQIKNVYRAMDQRIPKYVGLSQCYGHTPDPEIAASDPYAYPGSMAEGANDPVNRASPFGGIGPLNYRIISDQFCRTLRYGGFWTDDVAAVAGFEAEIRATSVSDIESANADLNGEPTAFNRDDKVGHWEGFRMADPTVSPPGTTERTPAGPVDVTVPGAAAPGAAPIVTPPSVPPPPFSLPPNDTASQPAPAPEAPQETPNTSSEPAPAPHPPHQAPTTRDPPVTNPTPSALSAWLGFFRG